jgi:ABC-type hemin transport system ATPase subunit
VLIKKLKESGKGILSVSHDLSFALKHSDRILLLQNGGVAFCGKPDDGDLIPAIEQALGVRILTHTAENETEYFIKEITKCSL